MKIKTSEPMKRLGRKFEQTLGQPLYVVGGTVRNALLLLPLSDTDVCSAVPADKLDGIEDGEFRLTERIYGLGTVVICQQYEGETYTYEYTAFRKDNYGRGGDHRPTAVFFTDDIGEDADRRDFTVNTLYADVVSGEVQDPTGAGLSDLKARVLRMVCAGTLEQDALRILRMVRQAAELGFDIDVATYRSAMKNIGNLKNISAERIREEFFALLMADTRYGETDAVLRGLHWLKELGAFVYIIPELLEGAGFSQTPQFHKYDVLEHSLRACAASGADLYVRVAALLHDIAKPQVFARDGNMYAHPQLGAERAKTVLHRLKTDKKFAQDVSELVEAHMFDLENTAQKKAVGRVIAKMGKEQFLRLCALREADFEGSGMGNQAISASKWRAVLAELEEQNAPLSREELAVDGCAIMEELNIPPGKQVGEILNMLHMIALKKPSQNNYKSLMRYARIIGVRPKSEN